MMDTDEMLEHVGKSNSELEHFLKEVKEQTKDGKSPKEISEDLYFVVGEEEVNIEWLLVNSVIFGVVWEKEDQKDRD